MPVEIGVGVGVGVGVAFAVGVEVRVAVGVAPTVAAAPAAGFAEVDGFVRVDPWDSTAACDVGSSAAVRSGRAVLSSGSGDAGVDDEVPGHGAVTATECGRVRTSAITTTATAPTAVKPSPAKTIGHRLALGGPGMAVVVPTKVGLTGDSSTARAIGLASGICTVAAFTDPGDSVIT